MKYEKPPLTFEKQAELLLSRGLIADKSFLINCLKNVNYYRLSGYLYPYRQSDDTFKEGTTLEEVWRHYTFDRRLRLIVMDAIERIEISVRTQLVYYLAHKTKAFGYIEPKELPKLSAVEHRRLLKTIQDESKRSRENFVGHFINKYGDCHKYLPIWMTGEIVSLGVLFTMYRGLPDIVKREMGQYYGIPDQVLTSWLKTINVIRNICAHHSRLWNRVLGVKPFIPRKNKYPQWHNPVSISQDRVFSVLTIFRYLLKIIAPQSNWNNRFSALLDEYPDISKWNMGFPDNWQRSPIWKK